MCGETHSLVCTEPLEGACAEFPCGLGRCLNSTDDPGYECDCTGMGMVGDRCEIDVPECAVNNGGCSDTCVEMRGQAPVCQCSTPGYKLGDDGTSCIPDSCGCAQLCTQHIDGSTSCSCLEGYSTSDDGATCVPDDCTGSMPCQNGGGCRGTAPHATCDCDGTGYTGDTCTDDLLECTIDNGGCAQTCVENVGAPPTCSCLPGHTSPDGGVTCVADTCPPEFPWEVAGRWCVTKLPLYSHSIGRTNCASLGGTPLRVASVGALDQLKALLHMDSVRRGRRVACQRRDVCSH